MVSLPPTFKCSTCRQYKVPDDFHRNRDPKCRARGFRAYSCRQCFKDRTAAKKRRQQQPQVPERERHERMNIRITPALKQRLMDQSDAQNKTQSLLASEALTAYLNYLERKPTS